MVDNKACLFYMIGITSSWWCHHMETFPALLAICAGNSPVPVNSPRKGRWHGALMFSLISAWINGWVNNREAGDLRHNRAHYDVIVMLSCILFDYIHHILDLISCNHCKYMNVCGLKRIKPSRTEMKYSGQPILITCRIMNWILAYTGHSKAWPWQYTVGRFMPFEIDYRHCLCYIKAGNSRPFAADQYIPW